MASSQAAFGGVKRSTKRQFGFTDATIVRDETLPKNVKTVYNYLATFCGEERSAYPGRTRMSRETGLSAAALDEAKRVGEEFGVWSIIRPDDELDEQGQPRGPREKRPVTNVYVLHDHGGGYVAGTGPGAKVKGKPRGRHVTRGAQNLSPHPAQNLNPPGSKSEPNQYQGPPPPDISTSAPRDDSIENPSAGSGRRTSSPTRKSKPKRITITPPKNLERLDEAAQMQTVVRCAVKAAGRVGRELAPGVTDSIGRMLRTNIDAHDARFLAKHIEKELNLALDGDETYQWMLRPVLASVPEADPWAS
jgi:hypothetical protein